MSNNENPSGLELLRKPFPAKGNMESRENSVIRKFKTRMEWENVCHPWAILELLDELSELKTSQTTATQAAVAAAMLKAAEEAGDGYVSKAFLLALIPADHMQALRELVEVLCPYANGVAAENWKRGFKGERCISVNGSAAHKYWLEGKKAARLLSPPERSE